MVIAIDGPAGAGKSTVARAVAERLGLTYLDTGAMYRCVGLAVSEAASHVAADPEVRAALVRKQQAIVADGDWVAEGRDIATVVAPDAAVKVFLHADPTERARRRAADLDLPYEHVLVQQRERDDRDNTAGRSTLEPAND